jgi:hypothetical protein
MKVLKNGYSKKCGIELMGFCLVIIKGISGKFIGVAFVTPKNKTKIFRFKTITTNKIKFSVN